MRIWDLPTRLFHWGLAAAVIAAVVTAKVGGNAMDWHVRIGLLILALLVFRGIWGVIGGRWSRFTSFLFSPAEVLRYLRSPATARQAWEIGHNPLGALSVFAILTVLMLQVGSGLVADDEIATVGPLVAHVDAAWSALGTRWHKTGGQWLVLALVALHLLAILLHRWVARHDLVGPMLSGDKWLSIPAKGSQDGASRRLLAAVVFALSLGLATWVAGLGG